MIITFCGHSDYIYNQEDEKLILNILEKECKNMQVDFYLGGYGGFDDFAYICAKKYKDIHKDSKLIFITPFLDERLNKVKEYLYKTYDDIIYPELEKVPKRLAIIKRNEWMITKAEYIFAYVKSHFGGAYRSLLYAKKRNKRFVNLYKGDYELY